MINKENSYKPSIIGNNHNIHYEIFGGINNDINWFEYYNHPVIQAREKHSVGLNMIYDNEFNNTYLVGDGLFTNKKNLYLTINVRDCMGIIIIGKNFVGVVHISWKNLYLGIIDKIFSLFKKELINNEILDFIITPHLLIENMEVKENFINLWKNHSKYGKYLKLSEILKTYNNKYYFSIFNIFKKILIEEYNINIEKIQLIPIDTYNNNHYSSFRRDGLYNSTTNQIIAYIK